MKKITLLLSLLLFTLGCTQSKDNNYIENKKISNKENKKMEDSLIKKVLKSQLEDGESLSLGEEFESHKFGEEDLQATIPIIKKQLESNGYNFLTNEDFNSRIKKIFNRIIDTNSGSKFLYASFTEKCQKDPIYTILPIYSGAFIVKNENFITELYALPEIIDYQSEYPELAQVENNSITRKNPDLGQEMIVPHWKDLKNLKIIRKRIAKINVARNMYLFNDSRSQFKWLILNDQYFMESLVKTFGYTDDPELLQWVIEKTKFDKNNPQDYGKLFWMKQCDGTLKIHANTFKVLQKLYTPEIENDMSNDTRFTLNYIKDYIEYFAPLESNDLTKTEKIKIIANIVYFAEQYKYDKKFV